MKQIALSSIYTQWKGINSQRLSFRKLSLDDEQSIYHYSSDPEVTKYVLFPTHKSIEDTKAFIKLNLEKYEKGEIACWGVTIKNTGELIGTADFVWWNLDHKKAEVGYCYAKEHWNKGYASEALMFFIY